MLTRYRIPFLYEHPVAVVDRGLTRVWYPDLQLAGQGIFIEYAGLVDRPEYAASLAHKQEVYRDNGLTALLLERDDLRGNWPDRLLGRIEGVLTDRLRAFQRTRAVSNSVSINHRAPAAESHPTIARSGRC